MSKLDRWKKRHAELETASGGRVPQWKEKEGQNRIRIVPGHYATDPEADFWEEVQKSFNVGPNNKVVTWPKEGTDAYSSFPLRALLEELKTKDDPESKKRVSLMRGKTRVVMFVIDRDEEEKGHQRWETNLGVLRDIIGITGDAEYGDITDPEKGVDLTITYTPKEKTKNKFPAWQIIPKRTSTPLGHPECLEEDLFEKHYVGEPSDPGFVEACMEGTEQEWIEARKAERAAGGASEQPADDTPPPQSAAPAGSEDKAVDDELQKIQDRKSKKKAPPKKAPDKETGLPKKIAETTYDVAHDGEAFELTGQEIYDRCQQGNPPDYVLGDDGEWHDADKVSEFFKVPAVSSVGADLESALD